jgi:hypothetical protein
LSRHVLARMMSGMDEACDLARARSVARATRRAKATE